MKKFAISALCALCLFGAFVCSSIQADTSNDTASELALSRVRIPIRY